MLTLTRKKDEAIIVDGNIEIKILDIQGDKVKIGIAAPKEVTIYREEIYQKIQVSNRAATKMEQETLSKFKDLWKS
ncbi:carbon storage regulator CsrA [Cellulosilyticum sp. I15G10I2]|uniref:carbon storage regulator CsrA n=1 Tax=Cellulosilyticum sp. I15G10I2 TaxID=1892843 RepID=UPI00085BCE65|nr:carbon storage regulator CsrA [Cellulosilyticum sp. I15G10I2]